MSAPTTTAAQSMPGRIMAGEIAEQPAVLRRILDEGAPRIRETAERDRRARHRASSCSPRAAPSDNAALYAKYLMEIALGQAVRADLHVHHHRVRRASRTCADVPGRHRQPVRRLPGPGGLHPGRARGRCDHPGGHQQPGSPLAAVSEFHIDVLAGPEKALPATKTYTAELLALYLFVEGLRGGDGARRQGAARARRADPRAPGRGQGSSPRATASPSGWCSPPAATATRPPRRPR